MEPFKDTATKVPQIYESPIFDDSYLKGPCVTIKCGCVKGLIGIRKSDIDWSRKYRVALSSVSVCINIWTRDAREWKCLHWDLYVNDWIIFWALEQVSKLYICMSFGCSCLTLSCVYSRCVNASPERAVLYFWHAKFWHFFAWSDWFGISLVMKIAC